MASSMVDPWVCAYHAFYGLDVCARVHRKGPNSTRAGSHHGGWSCEYTSRICGLWVHTSQDSARPRGQVGLTRLSLSVSHVRPSQSGAAKDSGLRACPSSRLIATGYVAVKISPTRSDDGPDFRQARSGAAPSLRAAEVVARNRLTNASMTSMTCTRRNFQARLYSKLACQLVRPLMMRYVLPQRPEHLVTPPRGSMMRVLESMSCNTDFCPCRVTIAVSFNLADAFVGNAIPYLLPQVRIEPKTLPGACESIEDFSAGWPTPHLCKATSKISDLLGAQAVVPSPHFGDHAHCLGISY